MLTAQTNLTSAEAEEKAVGRQLEQAEQRFEVGLRQQHRRAQPVHAMTVRARR